MCTERRAEIQAQTRASAVAWEGAGEARASRFVGVPFVEIRGVTDDANSTAAADYDANLKAAMENVAQVVASLDRRDTGVPGFSHVLIPQLYRGHPAR